MKKWGKKMLEDKNVLQQMILSGEFHRIDRKLKKRLMKLGPKRFIKNMKKNGMPVKEVIVLRDRFAKWQGASNQTN